MDIEGFRRLFGDSIRPTLDWARLTPLKPPVVEHAVDTRAELETLLTVWYVDSDGGAGDWRDPCSTPLTISEAARAPHSWPGNRAAHLESLQREFRQHPQPLVLMAPAYQVKDRMLLLDSTHRLVAACLAEADVRVLLLTVQGPADPVLLPDLACWAKKLGS